MMRAKRVPDHDIGVFDRAVGRGPGGQSVAARMLVRIVAGGVHLALGERRHPEVLGHKCGALADTRSCRREGADIAMRHQTIAGRLANGIQRVRIDYFPGPAAQRIDELLRFQLRFEHGLDAMERRANRIVRTLLIRLRHVPRRSSYRRRRYPGRDGN